MRGFFRMSESDYRSAAALCETLVKDLYFRLLCEVTLAVLFALTGHPGLAVVWLAVVLPCEISEVLLARTMKRAERITTRHLYLQFLISIGGGGAWSASGAYLWSTGSVIHMASGLLMIIGVTMHVTFKYADWLKGALVAACAPMLALFSLTIIPTDISVTLPERLLLLFGILGLLYYMFIVAGANFAKQEQLKEAVAASSAASRSKSSFLATMSHEIRTPMNGVLGMAELLERSDLDINQREMVRVIRSSGDTLIGVIDDILDLSKIEAGHLELAPYAFSVQELVHAVHATSEMSAKAKGLTFGCQLDAAQDLYLYGDALRLRQVIGNLVSNAVKFTDRGSVNIEFSAVPLDNSDQYKLTFTVTDTGPGLTREDLTRVFDPFVQGDDSMRRAHGGTGLGLAITQDLARMMNGNITVESAPGTGTMFTFVCQLSRAERPEVQNSEPVETRDDQIVQPNGYRPSILIAEDHPFNRRVVEMMLRPMDVDLLFVEDGLQAVSACTATPFDLVLMDIQMPGLTGIEALHQIREMERLHGRNHMPIIALTANAMKHQVEEYMEVGFDAHLAKPIVIEELFAVMNTALTEQV